MSVAVMAGVIAALERWRKIEERANRAEELEDEAKRLRRWS